MKNSLCLICFVLINIISLKAQTLRNKVPLNVNWRFITDSTNAGQGGVHLLATGKPSIKYVHITPDINLTDSTAKAAINLKLWEDEVTAVRDFMVTWPNGMNKQLQQKLPMLKPGETFIFTLKDMNARAGFDICTRPVTG